MIVCGTYTINFTIAFEIYSSSLSEFHLQFYFILHHIKMVHFKASKDVCWINSTLSVYILSFSGLWDVSLIYMYKFVHMRVHV